MFEAICAHLDDAALAVMCRSGSKKAAASAMREAEKRPVFALVHSAVTMKEKKKHWIFEEVCETGSLWGVRFLWKSGIGSVTWGLLAACKHGRADMAALIVSKGADDFNAGFIEKTRRDGKNITPAQQCRVEGAGFFARQPRPGTECLCTGFL